MLSLPSVPTMLEGILTFLSQYPILEKDTASMTLWRTTCETEWSYSIVPYLSEQEVPVANRLLDMVLDSYTHFIQLLESYEHSTSSTWSLASRQASIQSLLERPQIEQRSESWYQDALGLLSASQFHGILKPTRTRGQLVLQKASCIPIDSSARRTVVATNDLTPFTWGIRFEPVVRHIYEHLTSTKVIDLGRLKHPVDPRLAASPDGLVVEGPPHRLGRFVEFKAPVTRPILQKVPEEYRTQMQIQMEVGSVEECDYLEVKFQSQYKDKQCEPPTSDAVYRGTIFIIGNEEGIPLRYEYSPLNPTPSWTLTLELTEQVLETIPWSTSKWFLLPVGRSRPWFASVQPAIVSFWEDVAKAKEGTFVLPPSNRKTKEPHCNVLEETTETTETTEPTLEEQTSPIVE